MPKSRTRKNHSSKVAHQRMIDQHKSAKSKKENEKQNIEFAKMITDHQENVKLRRSEFARSLAESAEIDEQKQSNSSLMAQAAVHSVVIDE
jgi:Fe-S cluster assembly ATPase SufC